MNFRLSKNELEILRGVSIHHLLGISDTGRKTKMKCPFHAERTASFFIWPDGSFYCFGCATKGRGAIDLLTSLGYTFPEAIEELSNYL